MPGPEGAELYGGGADARGALDAGGILPELLGCIPPPGCCWAGAGSC